MTHSTIPDEEDLDDISKDIESLDYERSPSSTYVLKNIRLNPGITRKNFISSQIHYMLIIFTFGITDSLNPLLLLSKDYYGVKEEQIGTVLSKVLLVELFAKIAVSTLYGYLTDKFGSRKMLIYGALNTITAFYMAPMYSNVFPGYLASRLVLSNGACALFTLPFNADYVHDESKGTVAGFSNTISALGGFMANIYLKIFFYANVSLRTCFYITGTLIFISIISYSFGIKRNSDSARRTASIPKEKISFKQSLKEMLELYRDHAWLTISMILQVFGSATFYLSFTILTVYIKSLFPPEVDDNVPNTLINNAQTVMFLPNLLSNFICGFLIDKKNKIMECTIFSLISGIIGFVLAYLLEDPHSWNLYISTCLMGIMISGIFVVSSYLGTKYCPQEKRGIMTGMLSLAGYAGYSIVGAGCGYLYDNGAKNAPFIIYAGMLMLSLIWIIRIYQTKIQQK